MIHTQKTQLVTYETLIILSFFGSASRKQHNIYHLYVRPSHLVPHEICFYLTMNDFKEVYICDQLTFP